MIFFAKNNKNLSFFAKKSCKGKKKVVKVQSALVRRRNAEVFSQ
jgi:hypothetical protein